MFRKYEKTFRLNLPGFKANNKLALPDKDVKDLLSGKVVIEEKMDGANTGVIRTKDWFRLQKRGSLVDASEHEQFNRFKAWAHEAVERILRLPPHIILYGEFLWAQHHIYYNQLPDWFLVFDVFDIKGRQYFDYRARNELCKTCGFYPVPLIYHGHTTKEEILSLIPKVSLYGDRAEGIVIKRYAKRNYLRAKLVWPDFVKEVDESDHWMTHNLKTNKRKEEA